MGYVKKTIGKQAISISNCEIENFENEKLVIFCVSSVSQRPSLKAGAVPSMFFGFASPPDLLQIK